MSEDGLNPSDKDSESTRLPVSASQFSTHLVWTFAIRILMVGNSVVAGVIVARWLGAEGLGQLAVINVSVGTLVQFASLGLPSANTYFIAQDNSHFPRQPSTLWSSRCWSAGSWRWA